MNTLQKFFRNQFKEEKNTNQEILDNIQNFLKIISNNNSNINFNSNVFSPLLFLNMRNLDDKLNDVNFKYQVLIMIRIFVFI